jgi:nitrous oxide reductase accessory protein NosL
MKSLLALIALTALLIGCSNAQPQIETRVVQPNIIHPERPTPIRLKDEKLYPCKVDGQDVLCMKPQDAEILIENKVIVGRWVSEANNIIDYYRRVLPAPLL